MRMGRGWLGPSDPILPPQYSIAGDDAVTEGVTDLVRGTLCPALKALFEHGLKKPSLLGGACHPWLFIEEVLWAQQLELALEELVISVQWVWHFLHFLCFLSGGLQGLGQLDVRQDLR